MKWLFALVCAASCAPALAVFDLQQVSRYNPSAPAQTQFLKVVGKSNGGFVLGGQVAKDILVVEFDALGGVVRSQIWDTPSVERDRLQDLFVYADGRVLACAWNDANRVTLVQFSPQLTVNWEVVSPMQAGMASLDGSGNAYLVKMNQVGTPVESYSASGALLNSTVVSSLYAYTAKGIPGTTHPGLIVAGRDTTALRARVVRLSPTLTTAYNRLASAGAPGAAARFNDLDIEPDADVVLGGQVEGGSPLYGRVNNAGTTFSMIPDHPAIIEDVYIINSTQALLASAGFFTLITRSTGAKIWTHEDFDAIPALISSNRIVLFRYPSRPSTILNIATGSASSDWVSEGVYKDAISHGIDNAIGVGSKGDEGFIGVVESIYVHELGYQFPGGHDRALRDSATLSDGSVAFLFNESGPSSRPGVGRYAPNGSLTFARALPFGSQSAASGQIDVGSDNSMAIAGSLAPSGWFFGKYSSAGAVLAAKAFPLPRTFFDVQVEALNDGTSMVIGITESQLLFFRMSATGAVMTQNAIDYPLPIELSDTRMLSNGNVALACRGTTGDNRILVINPLVGTVVDSANIDGIAHLTLNSAGDIVLGYQNGSGNLVLERRNHATLDIQTQRTVGPIASLEAIAVNPNGNTYCLIEMASGPDLLRLFSSTFTDVVTSELPATITKPVSIAIAPSHIAYVTAEETVGDVINTYSALYLASGVRSAQRRTAGAPQGIHVGGSGIWVMGEVGTRKKGWGPFAARYSL